MNRDNPIKPTNPYRGLPDHQFWRRSVAAIEPFRLDPVVATRFVISRNDRVATAGSCFAQHISKRLSQIGFNYFVTEAGHTLEPEQRASNNYGVFSARFGNIYTTRQLLQLFLECFGRRPVAEAAWARADGRHVDALRPQVAPDGYSTEHDVRVERETHLAAVRRMFEDSDVFVFTLGLTETWQSRIDGTVYPVAPGVSGGSFDDERHAFLNLDVQQVMADLEEFLNGIKSVNPRVKVILTVSPVPLIATYEPRHVLVATTYSKSVLRVAADAAYRKYDWVDYFPSYEIITGNFNDSAYYEADYRGINSIGVDHVMRCFLAHYTDTGIAAAQEPVAPMPSQSFTDVVCDEEAIDQIRV